MASRSPATTVAPIVTERLILRPLTVADALALLAGDRAGRDWSPGYPTAGDLEVARALLARPPTGASELRFGPRQIALRETGVAVGGIGFFGPPDEEGTIGIGYGIAPEVRGRGLTTEAVRGMLALARSDPTVRRVLADTEHDNHASRRVLEKAGFRLTYVEKEHRYYLFEPR